MATRVRRDAGSLPEWDDTFLWYARAVAELQKRPLDDPTSWRYLAAVHGIEGAQVQPGDPIPSDNKHFWNECQHHGWYFFPWHRWYLLYFEETIRATIAQLPGGENVDWALPYWNYSKGEESRRLPAAFIAEQTPDGVDNPLLAERDFGNDGSAVGDEDTVSLEFLAEPKFTGDPAPLSSGFGGDKTRFSHSGRRNGRLERVPHGSMHGAVGGFMGAFETAGLDPLFWLHHANIDRLWVVWRDRDANHLDPTDPDWLEMSFEFHDGNGKVVSKKVGDAVDTKALGYEYDDTSDPLATEAPVLSAAAGDDMDTGRTPEMVGATEQPVTLTSGTTSAVVPVTAPTGPALLGAEAGEDGRLYVTVENVTGNGKAKNYKVYVNDVFAGMLPTFGVREATPSSDKHAGGGLDYEFDVTKVAQEHGWDPNTVRVTFVAAEQEQEGGAVLSAAGDEEPQFQVGRIGVYRA